MSIIDRLIKPSILLLSNVKSNKFRRSERNRQPHEEDRGTKGECIYGTTGKDSIRVSEEESISGRTLSVSKGIYQQRREEGKGEECQTSRSSKSKEQRTSPTGSSSNILTFTLLFFLVIMLTLTFLPMVRDYTMSNCKIESDNDTGHTIYRGKQYC